MFQGIVSRRRRIDEPAPEQDIRSTHMQGRVYSYCPINHSPLVFSNTRLGQFSLEGMARSLARISPPKNANNRKSHTFFLFSFCFTFQTKRNGKQKIFNKCTRGAIILDPKHRLSRSTPRTVNRMWSEESSTHSFGGALRPTHSPPQRAPQVTRHCG